MTIEQIVRKPKTPSPPVPNFDMTAMTLSRAVKSKVVGQF